MTNFQKRFDTDANGNPLTEIPRANDEFGGFTIGGPIVKNKAFLFGGFDQEIISQKTSIRPAHSRSTPAGPRSPGRLLSPNSQSLAALQKFGPYGVSAGNPTPIGDLQNLSAACPAATFAGVERTLPTNTHNFNFVNRVDYQLGSDIDGPLHLQPWQRFQC